MKIRTGQQTRLSRRMRWAMAGAACCISTVAIMFYVFTGQVASPEKALAGSEPTIKKETKSQESDHSVQHTVIQNDISQESNKRIGGKNNEGSNIAARPGYVDMTVVGNMFVSSGTIVSDEGSINNTSTGTLENRGYIYIKGDWTNDGTYVSDTGKVIFWGTDAATVNGTANTVIYNVEVSNTGGVTLNRNLEVSNKLNLVAGGVDLNSNTLTISNNKVTGITYSAGYLISEDSDNSSKVQWNIGNTTGAHAIPFGTTGGIQIPLIINLTSGDIGNLTTSTYPTASDNTPLPLTPVTVEHVRDNFGNDNSPNTVNRFWQIDNTGSDAIITATFTYADAETPANGELNLQAQRYWSTFASWDAGVPFQVGNTSANTVEAPGISTFGPYTLATNANPLPVELLSFDAVLNDMKEVDLTWVTGSEINNDYFTVQRTSNLVSIEEIEKINGQGNTNVTHHYATRDRNPLHGKSYYRLKQTDFDGKFGYSDWRPVSTNNAGQTDKLAINTVYPNPYVDEFHVQYELPFDGEVDVQLVSNSGQVVFSDKIQASKGSNTYTYMNNSNISPGSYYFRMTFDGQTTTVKLVRKQ